MVPGSAYPEQLLPEPVMLSEAPSPVPALSLSLLLREVPKQAVSPPQLGPSGAAWERGSWEISHQQPRREWGTHFWAVGLASQNIPFALRTPNSTRPQVLRVLPRERWSVTTRMKEEGGHIDLLTGWMNTTWEGALGISLYARKDSKITYTFTFYSSPWEELSYYPDFNVKLYMYYYFSFDDEKTDVHRG